MLIDMTVANFRSIKNPQTVAFQALKDKRMDQTKIQIVSNKLKVLRTAAIVGPNGVGKSTIVRALEAVKGIVTADSEEENPLRKILAGSLFAYSDVKNQPAEFTLRVLLREYVSEEEPEVVATYTLKADLDHVWEESLYYNFGTSKKIMFERIAVAGIDEINYNTRWGKLYRGDKKKMMKSVDGKHTFLHAGAMKGGETCSELYDWFTKSLDILPMGVGTSSERYVAAMLNAHPSWKTQLINFFWSMDVTDIRDIRVGYSKDGKFVESNEGEMVFFIHTNSKAAMFSPYGKESLSMKRLSLIALAFFEAFTTGKVLVVDDYGMFLHPEVLTYLTGVFTKGCKRASQLIVVDCNPTLLEDGLLRKDAIYFAEKDSEGSTIYYPLSDFRISANAKVKALYESGAFGALPITSEFCFVNEEA
ncbi:MAG: ATP-binding protein [Sphaerochaetaceae bacterium]|nr:ATP-binding protein [Sphaerochaetaceae bacterium]